MVEENTIQERLTEIFDDSNIYTEIRVRILDFICDELYKSKLKDTHFYSNPRVFAQFLDIIIEDILNDCDFEEDLRKLNKLRNLEYSPREIYEFRRDHSGPKNNLNDDIRKKILQGKRLKLNEKKQYAKWDQKHNEEVYNNQLALWYFERSILTAKEEKRLKEYFNSLISEEEAFTKMQIENAPIIKEMREDMKKKYFEKHLSEMPALVQIIEDPFELKEYERKEEIYKGTNGSTEFVRVGEPSNEASSHDFEVASEYIIIDSKPYHIEGSGIYYSEGCITSNEHYVHTFLIYMPPKENEYPEGTHLSDLIRKKKETKLLKEFKALCMEIQANGNNPEDFLKIIQGDEGDKEIE